MYLTETISYTLKNTEISLYQKISTLIDISERHLIMCMKDPMQGKIHNRFNCECLGHDCTEWESVQP